MTAYAHSVPGRPEANWEQLGDHLRAVAGRAEEFASAFGWGGAAGAAGLLHDIGKTSAQFQSYIRLVQAAAGVEHIRGGDHSAAGARVGVGGDSWVA